MRNGGFWFQLFFEIALTIGLVWRRRTGKWKRPHTFKWAMMLMGLAIALTTTAGILQIYGK